MLISIEGRLKLTDFGLSKISADKRKTNKPRSNALKCSKLLLNEVVVFSEIRISDLLNTPGVKTSKQSYLRTPGQVLSLMSRISFVIHSQTPLHSLL